MQVNRESEKPKGKHSPHVAQPIEAADNPDALLRLTTAEILTGMGLSTLYKHAANDPTFPKLIKLGTRCTRIRAGDLMDWLKAQAAKANDPEAPNAAEQCKPPVVVSLATATPPAKRGRPRKIEVPHG